MKKAVYPAALAARSVPWILTRWRSFILLSVFCAANVLRPARKKPCIWGLRRRPLRLLQIRIKMKDGEVYMKQKICALLLALLVMAAAVPAMAAESDKPDNSNYQQSDDGCKDGVCPWKKGGK